MLKCTFCDKVFKYESERKRHEQSHTPQFECNECSKKFSFLSALKRHKKQHKRTGSVQCNECGRNFKDDTLLLRHFKYAHKDTHICPKCSAKFNSDLALSCHLKTHRPKSERKFHCNYYGCNKSFNYLHHFKHHEMIHTKMKEHYCNICKKGFTQAHHLKSHLKTHEPENWLHCTAPLCKKTFPTEYALRRHLSTHKAVLCSSCGQLVSLSSYDTHLPKCKPHKDLQPEDLSIITRMNVENNNYLNKIETDKLFLDDWGTNKKSTNTNILVEALENYHENVSLNNNVSVTDQNQIFLPNVVENSCKSCECFTNSKGGNLQNKETIKDLMHNMFTNDNSPNIEYTSDGTIKLKETCDFDFEVKSLVKEFKMDFVPYNSCKDILGKCIVSGNGTISDECLCARMAIDDQQIIAEEVDEITPKPTMS